MIIKKTEEFDRWLRRLKDGLAKDRIKAAIYEAGYDGGFADVKYVGKGVYEARLFFGPGYRLYYAPRGGAMVLLLAGGDKTSQRRDIQKAWAINADELRRRKNGKGS